MAVSRDPSRHRTEQPRRPSQLGVNSQVSRSATGKSLRRHSGSRSTSPAPPARSNLSRANSPTLSEAGSACSQWGDDSDAALQKVFGLWGEEEQMEPTDPYGVLRLEPGASADDVREQSQKLQSRCSRGGVGRVLRLRFRRAEELLCDDDARQQLHIGRELRCLENAWATLQYPNGRYEGEVKEKPRGMTVRDGRGVTVLVGGERYEGAYVLDHRHGLGLQIWACGDVYLGDWADDALHGAGLYYFAAGPVYNGQFHRGRRHGSGEMRWRRGSCFEGQFVEDQRQGQGVETLMGHTGVKSRYEGLWQAGKKHGHGSYEAPEGRYQGQFEGNLFHGAGAWELSDGDTYEGEFLYGQPHGSACHRWSSGSSYTGEFRRGRLHGTGELTSTGLSYAGGWESDAPHGQGKMSAKTQFGVGDYDGEWRNGLKHGQGHYSWPNGAKFTGEFAKDMRHGDATMTWSDGSEWCGKLTEDIRHGNAKFRAAGVPLEMQERWHYGILCERDRNPVRVAGPQINDVLIAERRDKEIKSHTRFDQIANSL